MERDSPTCRDFVAKPEALIELVDARQGNLLHRIVTRQLDQPMHVPNQCMSIHKLRMVLSSHLAFLCRVLSAINAGIRSPGSKAKAQFREYAAIELEQAELRIRIAAVQLRAHGDLPTVVQ